MAEISNMPPGRPRNFDTDQVLGQAMSVFWQKGYEGTGLTDLEHATGLGRQSLYGAFGDKRALFTRVVEHYFDRVLKPGIIDVLDAPGSARQNLERLFEQWEAHAASPDFNGCLVGNAVSEFGLRDREMGGILARKLRALEQALCRALKRAQQNNEIPSSVKVIPVARSLLTTAQGLAVVARVQRDPSFVRGVLASARKLLE